MSPARVFNQILTFIVVVALLVSGFWLYRWLEEDRVLRQVIDRLSAESRIAEVLVTKSEFDEATEKILTTIKFLEFDTQGNPLEPKYFTFFGNLIQFQSLVIRFQDELIRRGDHLRGKSAYLFLKVFVLEGEQTQEFEISPAQEIPSGYKIPGVESDFEAELWKKFWAYALDPSVREHAGIKNAQIEAPGSLFIPGTIYTLRIEHDGGLRIDARPVPEILKGEKL